MDEHICVVLNSDGQTVLELGWFDIGAELP